jgi:hypothetical protein
VHALRAPVLAPCAQREIEKVKLRREQRAAEKAQQEEELSLIARERAVAEGLEMEAKEEEVRTLGGVLSLHERYSGSPC